MLKEKKNNGWLLTGFELTPDLPSIDYKSLFTNSLISLKGFTIKRMLGGYTFASTFMFMKNLQWSKYKTFCIYEQCYENNIIWINIPYTAKEIIKENETKS